MSAAANPLLADWNTPFGIPPFSAITAEDFKPALDAALAAHRAEIDAIANNPAPASFANTLVAFDRSGKLLAKVEAVFDNLCNSETSPALQAVEREMAAPLAAHSNFIYTHSALFARIDTLHEQRATLGLDAEQLRLLERVHLDFVRAGAKLSPAAKARYGGIMEALATLNTAFGQNVLADEAAYRLVLRDQSEIAGLPDYVLASAQQAARERGIEDGYVITLSRSHIVPFLTYSSRRDLREQAFKAWLQRGEATAERDNKVVAKQIMELRLEQAKLHGYACFADYALADTMAGTQHAVVDLLQNVWTRAVPKALAEADALQAMALSCGDQITIEAWDWFYYAEKVRKARYDFDDAAVKPYFSLERMTEAMFDCAHRLFGVSFIERPEFPVYHPDVKAYEMRDAQGQPQAIFLHDNFARASKRGGAWMSAYRVQQLAVGDEQSGVIPIVVNNNNFAKGSPTLLSFDDARTLFHEFGHGLHGMLSKVHYKRLAGTAVLRDFVELPSQLFEHWLSEPAVLKKHARHVQTGEPIPDEMLQKLKVARQFNQGFDSVTYTASALVDIALHAKTDMQGLDLAAVERDELARIGIPKMLYMRHRLPHFQHLFSGSSYAAAYYVYLWAEVLDADAYNAFTEAGDPFAGEVAQRLLHNIYAAGGTRPPMQAYAAFRGRAPTVEPMLKKKGLVPA